MRTPLLCADGSYTFYEHGISEAYHPPWGSWTEARERFIVPVELARRAREAGEGGILLLDVGYGMGHVLAAALDELATQAPHVRITAYGLEKDPSIITEAFTLPFPYRCKGFLERLAASYDAKQEACHLAEGNLSVTILIGDARERLKDVPEGVDIVFFDPFSPRVDQSLWKTTVFSLIKERCKPGAVLVTYSCARATKEALKEAGFLLAAGPVVGRRGPGTVAHVPQA
jgi:chorismate dehydratase